MKSKIYNDITETIGSTPLVRLKNKGKDLAAEVLLKLEFFNPLSSVKDRIGLNMIVHAEELGLLKPGMRIVEPTSGNTGIALAFVCASRGYPLTLVMPETMSIERRTLLLMLGADLVLTPAPLGMRGAVAKATEIFQNSDNIFMPSQFDNIANPEIHRKTTAEEIWNDTSGKIDILVSGVGTGGTATGVGEILKQRNPKMKLVVVEPAESPIISGGKPGPHKIQGIGAGFIPKNLNKNIIDEIEAVSSEEALATARSIIKEEGIPVGISSGAAIAAGLRQAKKAENSGKRIVIIVASGTERYLSTALAEKERAIAQSLPVSEVDEEILKKINL